MVSRGAAAGVCGVSALGALLFGAPAAAAAHPLHTTVTVAGYDPAARALTLSVRAFADDYGAAAGAPGDAAHVAYARRTVRVLDAAGRAVPLAGCGVRRAAPLVWVCLRAPLPAAPRAGTLRVQVAVLAERFADQVNVLQAHFGRATRTVLFTPGDGAKPL